MGSKIPMGTEYLSQEKLMLKLGLTELTQAQRDMLYYANMCIDLHASTNTYYLDDNVTIPPPLEMAAYAQYTAIEEGEILTSGGSTGGSFSIGSWSESTDSDSTGGSGTEGGSVMGLGLQTKSILKTYGYLYTGNVVVC